VVISGVLTWTSLSILCLSCLFFLSFESISVVRLEDLNQMVVIFTYFSMPLSHCIDQRFQNFFQNYDENKEEGIPRDLQNLINKEEERHAKPLMNGIMPINVSTEKDHRFGPDWFYIVFRGARASSHFIKRFQNYFCEVL